MSYFHEKFSIFDGKEDFRSDFKEEQRFSKALKDKWK